MRRKIVIVAALLIVVLAGGGFAYMHGSAPEKSAAPPASPPVPIVAGVVAQHDVPIYLTGVGTVIAFNTVVVHSQIQGQIVSINFTEGQSVHTGDLLAQIDPRPYQAQIDQFTATLDRDRAQLQNAEANLARYTPLLSRGFATPQLVDTQKAQIAQLGTRGRAWSATSRHCLRAAAASSWAAASSPSRMHSRRKTRRHRRRHRRYRSLPAWSPNTTCRFI